ncbi:MAG: hypothetical protein J0L92_27995 [Deltaproteobacteria bacterium]|nr:hypothetical protein [Deltaproteobacteria bacterium]
MQSWPRFPANVSDPMHDDASPSDIEHERHARGPYRNAPCAVCAERESRATREPPRRDRAKVPAATLAIGAVAGAVLVGSVTALTTPRLDAQASRLSSLERRMTETELDARAFEGRMDDHVSRLEANVGAQEIRAASALQALRGEISEAREVHEPPREGFDVVEVSPTQYLVARSVILGQDASMLAAARLIPSERAGVVIGVRVFGVRAGTLPARLGVLDGDTLVSVNGVSLAASPDVDRLASIARDSTAIELVILRRGTLMRLHYTVVG